MLINRIGRLFTFPGFTSKPEKLCGIIATVDRRDIGLLATVSRENVGIVATVDRRDIGIIGTVENC